MEYESKMYLTKIHLYTYILFVARIFLEGSNSIHRHIFLHFFFILRRKWKVAILSSQQTLGRFCILRQWWQWLKLETISMSCYKERTLRPLKLWTLTVFGRGVDPVKNELLLCSWKQEELFNYTSRDWGERLAGGNGAACWEKEEASGTHRERLPNKHPDHESIPPWASAN